MTIMNARFASLAQSIDEVHATHGALTQHRDDLHSLLTGLRGSWAGGASLDWNQAQKDWNAAHDDVLAILDGLREALEVTLANYTSTEKGLRHLWGGGQARVL
jgi:WXG100 family type VII secretion target